MLEGKELAAAIRAAIDKKRERPETAKYGPTALGKALHITQPSASELTKTGRLAKSKIWKLVEEFSDVVGPDHWGLPLTAREMQFLGLLRQVPESAQDSLLERLQRAAEESRALTKKLVGDLDQAEKTAGAGAAAKRRPSIKPAALPASGQGTASAPADEARNPRR